MVDTEAFAEKLNEFAEKQDFDGAFRLVKGNQAEIAKCLNPAGVKDALKKTTSDRLLLSFLDGCGFGEFKLDEALVRLEKLVSFKEGALVLQKTWGLGKVRRLDYFYRRITVDFKVRKGHQFTYAAAVDMLEPAPDGHILVFRESDPAAFDTLLKEKPGDFVKRVVRSNGSSMTLIRLEDYCVANGFVKSVNWKRFWESARTELKKDECVVIPLKKTDPIEVKEKSEDYGERWLTAFSQKTDPKMILASVKEFVAGGRFAAATEAEKAVVGERLAFAVTAARKVDDALYARLACLVTELGFAVPPADEMRGYLRDRKRYIKAAESLPAREVGAMIAFLADSEEAKSRLYAAIPEFCFTAVTEIVNQFKSDDSCRRAIGDFMKNTEAPATLTTLIAGKIEQFGRFEYAEVAVDGKGIRVLKRYELWEELPRLITLLTHAIALGEGRRSGEILRMQNLVRKLFGSKEWLEKMFKMLEPADQVLFFERFQASIAWDPSTHHATVMRMTNIVPALKSHLVKAEKKKEYARVTSYRSFAVRKAEYLKLINEDMPANVKRIEFAKSYGDLSENAEYQYAKDEQRALMQKQSLMQADLEVVKPADFSDATTDEVMPGVEVLVRLPDGEKAYSVLGEWDNEPELGVLSSKARLAVNMLGKKAGDDFELPGSGGGASFGRILSIRPLSDRVREWMKVPEGMQI